jgi:hypothetical protein
VVAWDVDSLHCERVVEASIVQLHILGLFLLYCMCALLYDYFLVWPGKFSIAQHTRPWRLSGTVCGVEGTPESLRLLRLKHLMSSVYLKLVLQASMLLRVHHKVTHFPNTPPDNTRKCLSSPPLGSFYVIMTIAGIVHQLGVKRSSRKLSAGT